MPNPFPQNSAQSPDEIFDVVDGNDRVTGQATRAEVHRKKLFHRAVHILVFDGRGNVVLQKRSLAKDTCPGLFSTSCAGHVDSGESYDAAAVRELGEELGVPRDVAGTLRFLFALRPCDALGMEFVRVYRLDFAGTLTPNPAEISELLALPPTEIDARIEAAPNAFAESFRRVWTTFRERELLEQIFSGQSGKITGTLGDAPFPRDLARELGAKFAEAENLSIERSVFENVSAPLAAAGTPWEIARERITGEILFWFGNAAEENAIAERIAGTFDRAARTRIALARAFAEKPAAGTPVVLSETTCELEPEIFLRLKKRAEEENFAVVFERASRENLAAFDALAFFPNANADASDDGARPVLCTLHEAESAPESLFVARSLRACRIGARGNDARREPDVLRGSVIGAGAGEFLAEIAGTEIHGKLCGASEEDVPAGTPVDVFLPPEIFHVDTIPPEENAFALADGGEIFFDGELFFRRFRLENGAGTLNVAAQHRQSLESSEGAPLFAWCFPEDVIGFPRRSGGNVI